MKGCYSIDRVIITSGNEMYCKACMRAVATTQSVLTGEATRKLQTSSGGRVIRKAKSFVQDAVVRWIEKLAKTM